jgi:DNA-binding XRE family transcriptional regulator
MNVQFIKTPGGEELAVLSREDFEDLIDARDAALAKREIAAGRMETFCEAETAEYLAAPSPLAFWRKRSGLTQAALADAAGISQAYLAQIEAGDRIGTVDTCHKLAKALDVPLQYLIVGKG